MFLIRLEQGSSGENKTNKKPTMKEGNGLLLSG